MRIKGAPVCVVAIGMGAIEQLNEGTEVSNCICRRVHSCIYMGCAMCLNMSVCYNYSVCIYTQVYTV